MPKRTFKGVVISKKQIDTVVVSVESRKSHPLLKKTVRSTKHYHAHIENQDLSEGDEVTIEEMPPRSKLKKWRVV